MEHLDLVDQDVLNIFFKGISGRIDVKFNMMYYFGFSNVAANYDFRRNLPIVIHFTGESKPWLFQNSHPYKGYYIHYLRKTPFKNYRYPDFTTANVIRRIFSEENFRNLIKCLPLVNTLRYSRQKLNQMKSLLFSTPRL